jgi:nitric oxide reductase NorD protein
LTRPSEAAFERTSTTAPSSQAIRRYLRLLWPQAPDAVELDAREGQSPHLIGRGLHLPEQAPARAAPSHRAWHHAAAAHAAAHLAYSPAVFDGRGLGPIVRALMGVLEDARVESRAAQALPGLARLWRRLHTACAEDGSGFESLLLRLARALIDPAYDDPHAWIAKGRAMCLDAQGEVIAALDDPVQVRRVATLLGNDIGQMRLRFNSKTYVPGPDYRDDLRWMWPSGSPQDTHAVPQQQAGAAEPPPDQSPAVPPVTGARLSRYPEWDRLIGRARPAWTVVHEWPPQRLDEQGATVHRVGLDAAQVAHAVDRHRYARLVQALRQRGVRRQRAGPLTDEGERLDLDAVVRSAASHGHPVRLDGRFWRRLAPQRRGERTLLVIDASASSADPWLSRGHAGSSLLQGSCQVALLLAQALQACGVSVAIVAFSSEGRQAVSVQRVLDFTEPFSARVIDRIKALAPRHSTRLGASLRHAAHRTLQAPGNGAARVVLIGDAQPWDIDMHDPRYLSADARMAVTRASKSGVALFAIVLDPSSASVATRIFGAGHCALLRSLDELPAVVGRIGL